MPFEDLDKDILKVYTSTQNLAEIARRLNLSKSQMGRHAKRLGLKGNGTNKVIWVDDVNVQCNKCDRIVPFTSLRVIRPNGPNRTTLSYCNRCRTSQIVNNNKSSEDSYYKNRIRGIKARAKENELPFDLDIEYLKVLYKKQNGKCFYTDVNLELPFNPDEVEKSRHRLSVDKIIPELGYVKGNVVLCTVRSNFMKNDCSPKEMKSWLPNWYSRIIANFPNYNLY